MSRKNGRRFRLSLMPVAMLCLSSCAPVVYSGCPVYPAAGEKVASELEKVSYEQAPAFWEWLGRIDKLRQELELCRRAG